MAMHRAAARDPLRSFVQKRLLWSAGASKGAGGQPAALHCLPSLREGSLRSPGACRRQGVRQARNRPQGLSRVRAHCSVSWPRRRTRYVRFAHCAQTTATSQMTKRAARAGHEPCASRLRRGAPPAARPRLCRSTEVLVDQTAQWWNSRQAVSGRGDFCGDEKRRAGVGARSALRHLTRRGCLNGAHEVSAVSSAARPRTEHRSGVGAQRRPPQHEPLPDTACRDARSAKDEDHPTTAMGREPPFVVLRVTRSEMDY